MRCTPFLCMICFFFKQKTAYEMRISDWSSDVCSSDLELHDHRDLELRHQLARPVEGLLELVGAPHADRLAAQPLGDGHVVDAVLAEVGQIGRASCRERVCQYV